MEQAIAGEEITEAWLRITAMNRPEGLSVGIALDARPFCARPSLL